MTPVPASPDHSGDQFVRERFERPTPAIPTSAQRDVEAVRLGATVARTRSGYTVISFHGEIDISTDDVLEEILANALSASPGTRIVLELNRVSFLSVRGLGLMLDAHQQARRGNGELALVVDEAAPCARVLRILPTEAHLVVFSTLTASVSDLPA